MEPKLFNSKHKQPWADELRPSNLAEFIGQEHLVGEKGPLSNQELHSLILWGPPGCGKTTLAKLLVAQSKHEFVMISPVSTGIREVKEIFQHAQELQDEQNKHTVIFIDEVHRFNKAQQDYFLPVVENGLITLIGATTENPSFEINSALLSRLTTYTLNELSNEDLGKILARIIKIKKLKITKSVQEILIDLADKDARQLINYLEILASKNKTISKEDIKDLNISLMHKHDKKGDSYYNLISALIKTIRGSNIDASLYWLCRLLDAGTQPEYIARRLIRIATEDIGMADPNALNVALNADKQYRILGSPEGELGLAEAVVYLAISPKSNRLYEAYTKVSKMVASGKTEPVPLHLRNAPTKLMKDLGWSKDYKYAHSEEEHYVPNENYLPKGVKPFTAYQPTEQGLEERIKKRMEYFRSLDAKAKKTSK